MSVTAEAVHSRRLGYEHSDATTPTATGGLKRLQDVVALALHHRRRLLGALLAPPAIAVLLIFLLAPVYRAQISLMVGTGPGQPPQPRNGSVLAAPLLTRNDLLTAEIALLSNPELVETTVARMGVTNLYPELSAARLGPQLARDTAIRTFEMALRVEPVKPRNTIQVTFEHSNGRMAARALDQFLTSYQELRAKMFDSPAASGFEQRIATDMKVLEHLERERAEINAAFGVADVGQQRSLLLQQRAEAELRLHQSADKADILSKRLAYLAQIRSTISPDMLSGKTDSNPAGTQTAEALMDLRQQEATLLTTYNSQHTLVRRVRQQIDNAQKQMSELRASRSAAGPSSFSDGATEQELATIQTELAPLKAQQSLDSVLIAVVSQKLQRLGDANAQVRAIDAKIAEQNEKLQSVLRLYNKASKDDETDQANMTTVMQTMNATTLDEPVFPNKLLLLGGGVVTGLIAAASIIAYAMSTRKKPLDAYGLLLGLGVPDLNAACVRATRRIDR